MQRDRSCTHHRSTDDNTKHTQLFHVTSSLVFYEWKDISLLRHVIDLNQLLMLAPSSAMRRWWHNAGFDVAEGLRRGTNLKFETQQCWTEKGRQNGQGSPWPTDAWGPWAKWPRRPAKDVEKTSPRRDVEICTLALCAIIIVCTIGGVFVVVAWWSDVIENSTKRLSGWRGWQKQRG
jgi:hypothetical protein